MKPLLSAATAPATGVSVNAASANRAFQASVAGAGTVGATVLIEGSNDDVNYLLLGTITLSGTTAASDGFVSQAAWTLVRARLTAINGTGAVATVTMGG